MNWQTLETCPKNRTVLLAAKPESHLWWKFGIGFYGTPLGKPILFDWGWAFPPTHWCELTAPDGGRTSLYPIPDNS